MPFSFAQDSAEKDQDAEKYSEASFKGLQFRSIGPALTSGRIGDLAMHPEKNGTYYVAVSSGGVWKTVNAGTTWTPVFDSQSSYSIGCITIDPDNPQVLWVGTGENNSQRSVGYGDGVYKSLDGGKSWKNVGLKESEHIGMIWIDPRDSDRVFVAAQGPLWSAGGDRGLYLTEDGGETWTKSLSISGNTGVSEIMADPADPDTMYAVSYQRRRRVWTLLNGGPESGIHKSTDGGKSWKKMTSGLPGGDLGRIGIAISPADPSVVYAVIEASGDKGGFFKSLDKGYTWKKQSDYVTGSPQYYQELKADPVDVNRVYALDTYMMVTEDGGKTFNSVETSSKHVDNHALWIDPANTDYLLAGCDGGIYESWDRGQNWHFKSNLPVTQFYRVATDNALPFYNVYGGTQDNYSLGGPSRTTTIHGITNADWLVTKGGDGFETQVDPDNPDIIYAQSQYGNLARFDKKSGERINIVPQPGKGEEPLRWNWNSPLMISPHSGTRLYFACQKLFRSDDRGNSWKAVSGDLSRSLDRNRLPIMGRVHGVDSIAKNASTSFYGAIVSLTESPVKEDLLVVGTDDGLIQVTTDGGAKWQKHESFPGVPERTYVSDLEASFHDPDVIYASFDNHKSGDFKPYLLRSSDLGKTWTSIAGNLPERGTVYTLVEDHVDPDLLFAGTEFGVFFTTDGGEKWIQLKGGLPTICVRELEIQRRENDLVAATFGRGFYILDDYTPLREIDREAMESEALLFVDARVPVYIQNSPLGPGKKGYQGDSYYTAPNPDFGATFTYYLKDGLKTKRQERQEKEKELQKENKDVFYPTWEELRQEDLEEKPVLILTVSDTADNVIRRITAPGTKGIHRISWDLRYPASTPVRGGGSGSRGRSRPGPLAVPGSYKVTLSRYLEGSFQALAGPVEFTTESIGTATLPAEDREALLAFQKKAARLQRAVLGAGNALEEASERIASVKKAAMETPGLEMAVLSRIRDLETKLEDIRVKLNGDSTISSRNEPTLPGIRSRVQGIVSGQITSTSAPTATQDESYQLAAEEFGKVLPELTKLIRTDLAEVEDILEKSNAPWTPGRIPVWQPE